MSPVCADSTAVSLEQLYTTTFHELRAPVSSINGYASLLLTGELGELKPRQREPVERIREICGALTATIGNLLTLAKSGVRQVQSSREFVDVAEAVREVGRSLQGEIRRKKLRFVQRQPARPARLWVDRSDLTQVILNLLSNAIKFTPAGGRVETAVSSRPRAVVLEVSDTGAGISPESLPRIFEEFYHLDHPETGAGAGSGLGLAIVKRVVDAYGGRIKVESRPGKGARFRVLLPVRPQERILEEFFEESWVQARQEKQYVGLILIQARLPGRRAAPAKDSIRFVDRVLRERLRREDRVFLLSGQTLLVVLVKVSREGFSMLTGRLERALKEDAERKGGRGPRIRWRLAAVLALQRGPLARFLERARRRLQNAGRGDHGSARAVPQNVPR